MVSAAISEHGPPARVLKAAERGDYELVVSARLSEELLRVLQREKFRRYFPGEAVPTFVRRVRMIVPLSEEGPIRRVTGDPDDDYLVALAIRSRAEFLVSGDRHLLDLAEISDGEGRKTRVLAPREFLAELEQRT